MKKLTIVLSAALMAIGSSAFTALEKTQTLYYKQGSTWQIFTGTPCPPDNQVQCQANQPNVGTVAVFTAQSDLSPYMTRP